MISNEFGSDFHYISNYDLRISNGFADFFKGIEQFYFSGRVALRAIISNGINKHSWKRIYIPTYYCQEVYDFVTDLNIEFEFYDCNPVQNLLPSFIEDDDKCAVLVVNYFGISIPDFSHLKNSAVIEDLTHDLSLINQSKADYVFGSLRKVLPVPVGGFVKSKEKLQEIASSLFSEEVALEKLSGMVLKKKYLEGKIKEKDIFRNLLIEAEHSFENLKTYTSLPLLVKEFFSELNIYKIISSKKHNSLLAKKQIRSNAKFDLLTSNSDSEYAIILKFHNTEEREELRKYLIKHNIYPMVLWPNHINEKDLILENTLLFVHIDFRYSFEDVQFITKIINQYSNNAI